MLVFGMASGFPIHHGAYQFDFFFPGSGFWEEMMMTT